MKTTLINEHSFCRVMSPYQLTNFFLEALFCSTSFYCACHLFLRNFLSTFASSLMLLSQFFSLPLFFFALSLAFVLSRSLCPLTSLPFPFPSFAFSRSPAANLRHPRNHSFPLPKEPFEPHMPMIVEHDSDREKGLTIFAFESDCVQFSTWQQMMSGHSFKKIASIC